MITDQKSRKIALAKREEFRIHLENICREVILGFDHLTIDWDETDTKYMQSAKSVTVYYANGYSKLINVEVNSWRAIVKDVLRWA